MAAKALPVMKGHEGGAGEVEEALTQQDGDGQPLDVKGPAAQREMMTHRTPVTA